MKRTRVVTFAALWPRYKLIQNSRSTFANILVSARVNGQTLLLCNSGPLTRVLDANNLVVRTYVQQHTCHLLSIDVSENVVDDGSLAEIVARSGFSLHIIRLISISSRALRSWRHSEQLLENPGTLIIPTQYYALISIDLDRHRHGFRTIPEPTESATSRPRLREV